MRKKVRMSDMTVLHQTFDFSGCKIALLHGDTILTILRDDISTIPYPNMWDFPGGYCVIIMTGA